MNFQDSNFGYTGFMEVQFYKADESPAWYSHRFSGYLIKNAETLDTLFELRQNLLTQHPNHQVLLVIDDVDQAIYQASHCLSRDFDSGAGFDKILKTSPGGYPGHLKNVLRANLPHHSLDAIKSDKFLEIDADETELNFINNNPALALGGPKLALLIESEDPLESFLCAPQGYFGPNPFVIYLYIEHMVKSHGLKFVGLGATYLYFETEGPLSSISAAKIAQSLTSFHDDYDANAAATMTEAMTGNSYVILTFRNW